MEREDLIVNSDLKITIKIDNFIRNYCYNFLSYLYANAGWKRVIFDTSKENYIDSYIKDKKIHVLISNNGTVILTCYCFTDILLVGEYLHSQFQYGRMAYYLVPDDKVSIKISGDFLNEEAEVFNKVENVQNVENGKGDGKSNEKFSGSESSEKSGTTTGSEESYDIVDEEKNDSEDTMQNIFSFFNNIKFADYF